MGVELGEANEEGGMRTSGELRCRSRLAEYPLSSFLEGSGE